MLAGNVRGIAEPLMAATLTADTLEPQRCAELAVALCLGLQGSRAIGSRQPGFLNSLNS